MSTPGTPRAEQSDPDQESLSAALIRRCGLSEQDVARIVQAQQTMNVHFVEAALTLGYVTQDDIDMAQASSRKLSLSRFTLTPGAELIIARDPFDPHSERIRALRTELLLRSDSLTEANVLAVVSPGAREGRSLLAAELAIAFAQLGQSTLLLDADLRHSRQHELFGSGVISGLSQALTQSRVPEMAVVQGLPQLSVMTAGQSVPNPLELLSDHRFEMLLDGWRRRYQHIIIDTPPVSLYSDAFAVAMVAGRVVVVTRAHYSRFSATRDLLKRLGTTRAQVLGAVLNHY